MNGFPVITTSLIECRCGGKFQILLSINPWGPFGSTFSVDPEDEDTHRPCYAGQT